MNLLEVVFFAEGHKIVFPIVGLILVLVVQDFDRNWAVGTG